MKQFWLKVAKWVLTHINEKDLIKSTKKDNELIEKAISLIDNELKK